MKFPRGIKKKKTRFYNLDIITYDYIITNSNAMNVFALEIAT